VDSYAPHLPYDSVVTANRQGALLAVSHLIEQGHKCIGLIGAYDKSPPSILERREGYLEALREYDLLPYIKDSDLLKQPAYLATKELLAKSPEVTAIFACNDEVATGVMQAIRDMGRSVPDDISVVGFDNLASSADLYPPLTTVHIHKTWMGRLGVRLLVERAKHPDQPQSATSLATHLVVRESVKHLTTSHAQPSAKRSTLKEVKVSVLGDSQGR
jgi:LacI family transcriptional regulator